MVEQNNFLVADDHKIITQSLSFIIKSLVKNANVVQINKLNDVLKTLQSTSFTMIILDISFPDGTTLQLIPTIRSLYPDLKILIFSGNDEDIFALRFINAGANGFISKLSSEEEIETAISKILQEGKYLSSSVKEKIADSFIYNKPVNVFEQLSDRELQIGKMLVAGYGNTQISERLSLQKSTVSTYKNRIFEKLNVTNLSDLIQLFQLYDNI